MASQFCQRKNKSGTKSKSREAKIYRSQQSLREGHIEIQFKKWVTDWEKRVFMDKLLIPKESCYVFNLHQYHLIHDLVERYHETCSEQVGQDRFAWTTFACAIMKQHQKFSLKYKKCRLNYCLYVLLWVGYYLRLPCSELVKEILREIIICTGNLRFMFSFLPGMSIRMYMYRTKPPSAEEKLCREYFSLIDHAESSHAHCHYKDLFKLSQPFLLYLVQHLTPLHRQASIVPTTLCEVLNKPVLQERKYTLLTLAVHYNDKDLVRLLLMLGASAETFYWDCCIENSISAERMMIASVNSIMGSRQFLINVVNIDLKELTEYMDSTVNTISTFAPLMQRSVFRSEQRKSNDLWSSEDSTYELNREIADRWGIGYERPCPTLQHICKIQIRHHIMQADKELLSNAVQQLPLPNMLIQYLNLQID